MQPVFSLDGKIKIRKLSPENKHLRSCGYLFYDYPILFYKVGEVRYCVRRWFNIAELKMQIKVV